MTYQNDDQQLKWIDLLAEQDFTVIDAFIDANTVSKFNAILDGLIAEDELKKAGIGTLGDFTIQREIRGDYIHWLNPETDTKFDAFFQPMEEVMQLIRRYCFLAISDFECHFAYYPAGAGYQKHLDQFNGRSNRVISAVLYLNEGWKLGDGGELIIHQDQEIVIEPLAGRLVLFKSAEVWHEVAKTSVPRRSITGWMLNNPVGLGFLNG
jgi:SM-20-related protein